MEGEEKDARVLPVQEGFSDRLASEAARPAHSRGETAVPVQSLPKGIWGYLHPEDAHHDPHGREAVQVLPLPDGI